MKEGDSAVKLNTMNFDTNKNTKDIQVSKSTLSSFSDGTNLMIDTRFKEAFTTPSVAMTLLSALMPFVKYRKENITEYLFNGDNLLGLSEEEIKETIRLLPTKEVSSSGKLTEYDVLLVYKNLQ